MLKVLYLHIQTQKLVLTYSNSLQMYGLRIMKENKISKYFDVPVEYFADTAVEERSENCE